MAWLTKQQNQDSRLHFASLANIAHPFAQKRQYETPLHPL